MPCIKKNTHTHTHSNTKQQPHTHYTLALTHTHTRQILVAQMGESGPYTCFPRWILSCYFEKVCVNFEKDSHEARISEIHIYLLFLEKNI